MSCREGRICRGVAHENHKELIDFIKEEKSSSSQCYILIQYWDGENIISVQIKNAH